MLDICFCGKARLYLLHYRTLKDFFQERLGLYSNGDSLYCSRAR